MTEEKVLRTEAERQNWPGRDAGGDQLTVAMCLQCQIERAEQKKRQSR